MRMISRMRASELWRRTVAVEWAMARGLDELELNREKDTLAMIERRSATGLREHSVHTSAGYRSRREFPFRAVLGRCLPSVAGASGERGRQGVHEPPDAQACGLAEGGNPLG